MKILTGARLGGVIAAASLLGACNPSVASLECPEIADEAKRISEGQQLKISEIRNVTQESRGEREARCTGEATWSNQEVSNVYLRAFASENGTMVEYRNQPFETPPAQ